MKKTIKIASILCVLSLGTSYSMDYWGTDTKVYGPLAGFVQDLGRFTPISEKLWAFHCGLKESNGDMRANQETHQIKELEKECPDGVFREFNHFKAIGLGLPDHSKLKYNLGELYFLGDGRTIDIDYQKAFAYYQMAASHDNPNVHFRLGEMYEGGLGVAQDESEALASFTRAGLGGNIPAMKKAARYYELGLGGEKIDIEKANVYYSQIAFHERDVQALKHYASYYEMGAHGREPDLDRALTIYQGLELLGDLEGTKKVQYLRQLGVGEILTPQESAQLGELGRAHWQKALTYHIKRAKEENSDSQFIMGEYYETGKVVGKVDLKTAMNWYRLAAKKGSPQAKEKLREYEQKHQIYRSQAEDLLGQKEYMKAYVLYLIADHYGDQESARILDAIRKPGRLDGKEKLLHKIKAKYLEEATKEFQTTAALLGCLPGYESNQTQTATPASLNKETPKPKRRKRNKKKKAEISQPVSQPAVPAPVVPEAIAQETSQVNSLPKEKAIAPELSLDTVVQKEAKKEEEVIAKLSNLSLLSDEPIETHPEMDTNDDKGPKEKKHRKTLNPIGRLFSKPSKEENAEEKRKEKESSPVVEEREKSRTLLRKKTLDADVSRSERSEKERKKKVDPTEESVERSTKRSHRDHSRRNTFDAADVSRSERSEKDKKKRKDLTEASVERSTKSSRHHHKKDRFENSLSERSEGASRSERSTHSRVESRTTKLSNYPSLNPLIAILNGTAVKNLRDVNLDEGVIEKTLEELKRLDRVSNHLKNNSIYSAGNHKIIRATFHKHDDSGQLWFKDPNKVKSFLIYVWDAIGCEGEPTIELLHQKLVEFRAIHLGTEALDAGEGQ